MLPRRSLIGGKVKAVYADLAHFPIDGVATGSEYSVCVARVDGKGVGATSMPADVARLPALPTVEAAIQAAHNRCPIMRKFGSTLR
jgi:hypothetical protein